MIESNKMKLSFTNLDRIYVVFILFCNNNNNNNNNNNSNNNNNKTQPCFEYHPLIDNSFKSFKQKNAWGNYERIYRIYKFCKVWWVKLKLSMLSFRPSKYVSKILQSIIITELINHYITYAMKVNVIESSCWTETLKN